MPRPRAGVLALALALARPPLPRADEQREVRELETVQKSVNGSGYYCRGCAVMVEAVHEHILGTVDRWGEPGFTIEVREFLNEHCSGAAGRGEEEQIQRACAELKGYGGVIGARHFGQSVPSDTLLYARTVRICTDELGMCYAAARPPSVLGKKKPGRHASKVWCAACATIAADLHDVLTRRDKEHETFLSDTHVQVAIAAECGNLHRRFPASRALSRVDEVCEELDDGGDLRRLQRALGGLDGDDKQSLALEFFQTGAVPAPHFRVYVCQSPLACVWETHRDVATCVLGRAVRRGSLRHRA
jgi:hypothetical protein